MRVLTRLPAALLLLASAPAFAEVVLPSPDERTPIDVIIVPTREPGPVRDSVLRQALAEVLEKHTDLAMRDLPVDVIEPCRGNLDCTIAAAQSQRPRSDYLLLITNLTDPESNTLSARL